MKSCRIAGLVVMFAAAGSPGLLAGEPNADQLIREFSGQAEPPERTAAQLEAAYAAVIGSLLPKMGSDNPGEQRGPQQTFQHICWRAARPAAEAERAAVCRAIAARLGPDTPKPARIWLLKQLEHIGRGEVVEGLASALHDKDPLIRERARRALQNNPSHQAASRLRSELDRARTSDWRVALINSLGCRADEASVGALIQQARSQDEHVRTAAVTALARIGHKPAASVIAAARTQGSPRARSAATDCYLLLADRLCDKDDKPAALDMYRKLLSASGHVKCAAIIGIGRAGGIDELPVIFGALADQDARIRGAGLAALELMPGENVTRAIATKVNTAPPAMKVGLLRALIRRSDKAALPTLIAAASDPDEDVRVAAFEGIGLFGDERAVGVLVDALAQAPGRARDAAIAAVNRIPGQAATDALAAALPKVGPQARVELVRALRTRRSPSVVPALLTCAEDPDDSVRTESFKSLGDLADVKAVPQMLRLLSKAKGTREQQAAEGAVVAVCRRIADENERIQPVLAELSRADLAGRVSLLRVVGRLGGSKALDVLRQSLKDANADVQDAAVRGLGNWPDAGAAPDLLRIARTATRQPHRVLALRGYVRLLNLPSDRPVKQTLSMYRDGLSAAGRAEEKKLLLAGLAEVKDLGALRIAEPYLRDAQLKEEAGAAVVKIARAISRSNPSEAAAALGRVLDVSTSDNTLKQAIDGLGDLAEPAAFAKIRPLVDRNGTARSAAAALVKIADKLPAERKDELVAALQAVLKVKGIDRRVASRCVELLRNAGVQVKDYAREQGFVTFWWLLGAFPNPGGELWDKSLPPEKEVKLDGTVPYKQKSYSWKPHHTASFDGVVDLYGAVRSSDNVGAYMYAEVTVAQARDVTFMMGSDDQIACWLNGKRIHANKINRGISVDQDRVNTRLEAGTNRILMKVLNGGDGWAACLRITDRSGQPLAFEQREK